MWNPIVTGENLPELKDDSVLIHFENGSIETVHIEDYFRPVTAGLDAEGNQLYVLMCFCHEPKMTHWMPLPNPPVNDKEN